MSSRKEDNQTSPANARDNKPGEESRGSRSHLEPDGTLVKPTPDASGASQSRNQADDVPEHWNVGDVILDTYEVIAELGAGSFGTVHKVHHKGWNTDLAVKSAFFNVPQEDIEREAEVWMELGLHPNIVSCFFVRNLGKVPRIFIEYVEGGTLHEWLHGDSAERSEETASMGECKDSPASSGKPRELTRAQRLAIAIEICRGMHHAHTFEWKGRDGVPQQGLVHRDLKPANILMTPEGMPRVTDFGLVRFGGRAPKRPPDPTGREGLADIEKNDDAFHTMVKSFRTEDGFEGTPAYAAPEQWKDPASVSFSADIYAFGVILYELFCGKRPFELPDKYRHAKQELICALYEPLHSREEPPDPASLVSDIDTELAHVMLQCLGKKPEDRPASFADICDKLKAIYQRIESEDYEVLHPEPKAAELLADSLNNRALSYLEMGQAERAQRLWKTALDADPHHIETTFNSGLCHWRVGKIDDEELVRRLEEVRSTQGSESRDEYLLGLVHLERNDGESAVCVLEEAAQGAGDQEEVMAALERSRMLGPSCVRIFEGHTDHVNAVALSADGQLGISGSSDGTLRLWELSSGRCVRIFKEQPREKFVGRVESVAITSDNKWVVAGYYMGSEGGTETVRLWELSTGRRVRTFEGHKSHVTVVALSMDDQWLLSGSVDKTLRLWELATGRCVRTFEGHTDHVNGVALSADGRWVLSGSEDRTLLLWEVHTGRCVRMFEGHSARVLAVALSADGRWALSAAMAGVYSYTRPDGTEVQEHGETSLRVWEVSTGRCVHMLDAGLSGARTCVFSQDGRWALSGGGSKLRLWEVATGRCMRTFEGHTGQVNSVCMSADGRLALSGSFDKTLRLWEVRPLSNHSTAKAPFAFSRISGGQEALDDELTFRRLLFESQQALAGDRIAESLEKAGEARRMRGRTRDLDGLELWTRLRQRTRCTAFGGGWTLRTLKGPPPEDVVKIIRTGIIAGKGLSAVSISADGTWGGAACRGATFQLWELPSGRCVRIFEGHDEPVMSIAFSANGRWVLSGSLDKTLRLWELRTGRCARVLEGHTDGVSSIALSPDGRWALSGGSDGTLRLWDITTGSFLRSYGYHYGSVRSVTFSADGRFAAAQSSQSFEIWDIASGRCVRSFTKQVGRVRVLVLSADGRFALSGNWDKTPVSGKTLRVWDLATSRCVRNFDDCKSVVSALSLSVDGEWALSSSGPILYLHNISTGQCVHTFEGHEGFVSSVALSADGRWALSASADNTLRLWQLDWELEAVNPADWDEGARPYLRNFLTLHTPYAAELRPEGKPTEEELTRALTREGRPTWSDEDFQQLLYTLGCANYGWLRPEGVKRELEKMAAKWDGPPDMFAEADALAAPVKPAPKVSAGTPRPRVTGASGKPRRPQAIRGTGRQGLPRRVPQGASRSLSGDRKKVQQFCTNCGKQVAEGIEFCTSCGATVKVMQVPTCPSCRKNVPGDAAFCTHCGSKLR